MIGSDQKDAAVDEKGGRYDANVFAVAEPHERLRIAESVDVAVGAFGSVGRLSGEDGEGARYVNGEAASAKI